MRREGGVVSRQSLSSKFDGCNGSEVGVFTSTMKRDDDHDASTPISPTNTTQPRIKETTTEHANCMMSTITTLRPRLSLPTCITLDKQSPCHHHHSRYRYSIWQNNKRSLLSSSSTTTNPSTTKVIFPTLTLTSDIQKYWYYKQQQHRFCSLCLSKLIRKWKSWLIMISFIILYITISSLSTITMMDQHQQQYDHHYSQMMWSRNTFMSIGERPNLYVSSSLSSSSGRRRRRQLRTQQSFQSVNTTTTKPLHYLSFGSSITYNTIQNDDGTVSSSLSSYPYLLDTNVHVVAIPTTSSSSSSSSNNNNYIDFAAACTQSLVDDTNTITSNMNVMLSSTTTTKRRSTPTTTLPDVITIEYTSIEPTSLSSSSSTSSNHHNILIQRLHRRYPNAIIVLVQLLNPFVHLQLVQQQRKQQQVNYNNYTSNSIVQDEDVIKKENDDELVEIIMNFQQWKQLYDHEQEQYDQSQKKEKEDISTLSFLSKEKNTRFDKLVHAMFNTVNEMNQNDSGGGGGSHYYWTTAVPEPSILTDTSSTTTSSSISKFESNSRILYYNHPIWNINNNKSNNVLENNTEMIEQMLLFWNHFILNNDENNNNIMLSSYGHEQIAMGIHTTIESFRMKQEQEYSNHPNDVLDISSYHNNNDNNIVQTENIGDWGSGDTCHIWYTTGNYHSIDMMGGQPVNVPVMNQNSIHSSKQTSTSSLTGYLQSIFTLGRRTSSVPHKHALEFSRILSSSYFDTNTRPVYDKTGNYITVYNPFATNRLLSLTYLTDSDGMSYPKTLIVLNDNPSVQIQPVHDLGTLNNNNNNINSGNNEQQQQQHIAKTSSVGYIPPGKSIVHLIPLQTTTLPFRLVGVSILAEEIYNTANNNNNNNDSSDSLEYAFEMDLNIPFR